MMKIYTKSGDKGFTSLIGGKRVPKYHQKIETYGTIDELIAHVGYISTFDIPEFIKEEMLEIQNHLMKACSSIAQDCGNQRALPEIKAEDIIFLEKAIDKMEQNLNPLRSFILPGGHSASAYLHIARTICRKAERKALKLSVEEDVEDKVLVYLNRLSDYLFVASRYILHDKNCNEIYWKT